MIESLFNRWWNLRHVYREVMRFGSRDPVHVKPLLEDLREFCRADQSCIIVAKDGHIDQYATAVAEGRREVYLRICSTLNLSDEALNRMREMENDNRID